MKGLQLIVFAAAVGYFYPARPQCTSGQELVTIEITTDDYGSETTWSLFSQTTGLIASGGPYGSNATYYEQVCVDTGDCYRFVIYDAFGDG
ncbi:MAG TPA: hypothetical protein VNJ07_04685, partial [Chitinophagales bacterium]|nr:hypothetical protein [Chitinophagales bacterium]